MAKLTQVIDRGLDRLAYEVQRLGIPSDEAMKLIATFATARIKVQEKPKAD